MMRPPITPRHALRINDLLLPTVGVLTQLELWLSRRGCLPTDDYWEKVAAAREALTRLTVETHYLACGRHVGRPDAGEPPGRSRRSEVE